MTYACRWLILLVASSSRLISCPIQSSTEERPARPLTSRSRLPATPGEERVVVPSGAENPSYEKTEFRCPAPPVDVRDETMLTPGSHARHRSRGTWWTVLHSHVADLKKILTPAAAAATAAPPDPKS